MWRSFVTLLAGLLVLSACGRGNSDSSSSAKYEGKEVKEIGCDKSAFDAVAAQRVKHRKLRGTLTTRKSANCTLVYWAKFTPDPSSKSAFTVTVESGKRTYSQKSEPKNPAIEAWTPVVAVHKGDKIISCVAAKPAYRKCVATTAV